MPGFRAWIAELFGAKPPPPPIKPSRLLNPKGLPANGEAALDKLEAHLFCWLLDAEPAAFRRQSTSDRTILAELRKRLTQGELDELPRQPLTLPMLLRALSDPDISRSEITDIILGDPAITDQLLQMANSPFFRPGDQTIETVDQAVFVLGLEGIRSVISAAVMRPMLAARNSGEALFAQRVWRWGLTCARSAELIARLQGQDSSAYFMVGLLPAMAYITLYREIQRIHRKTQAGSDPPPAVIREALQQFDWATTQVLANDWNLPPRYVAYLLAAERPMPDQRHMPLNDGIVLGTREALRHARQRNMADDELTAALSLTPEQFQPVRDNIRRMLLDGH